MIRNVIFDLDGTLYRGSEPISGAVKAVSELSERGVKVAFATNNSGATQEQLITKLQKMGFPAGEHNTLGTAKLAARFLKHQGLLSAFVVGEPGLHATVESSGIRLEPPYAAVVVGICRSFSYALIDSALQAILEGATFIATNRDRTYPIEGGRVQPGAGAMVASVAAASSVDPIVLGKPEPHLFLSLIETLQWNLAETLVVGDRFETDIVGGQAAQCQVAMVRTGVNSRESEGVPTYDSVRDLVSQMVF